MNTSRVPPESGQVQRSGPPLAHHHGTLLAGGVIWLAPLVLVPAAVLSLGQAQWLLAMVMAGLGLVTAAPLVAAWRQTVELFPQHLVWAKWGRSRAISYADIREIRSGMRAQSGQGSRVGLIEQRYLDLHLRAGDKLTFIEMDRHVDLCRQLAECLTRFEEGAAPSAAGRSRVGQHGR
jgi:hypothetical protein